MPPMTFQQKLDKTLRQLQSPVGSVSAQELLGAKRLKALAEEKVTMELLQETGAPRRVNVPSLREHGRKEVRDAAAACVHSWATQVGLDGEASLAKRAPEKRAPEAPGPAHATTTTTTTTWADTFELLQRPFHPKAEVRLDPVGVRQEAARQCTREYLSNLRQPARREEWRLQAQRREEAKRKEKEETRQAKRNLKRVAASPQWDAKAFEHEVEKRLAATPATPSPPQTQPEQRGRGRPRKHPEEAQPTAEQRQQQKRLKTEARDSEKAKTAKEKALQKELKGLSRSFQSGGGRWVESASSSGAPYRDGDAGTLTFTSRAGAEQLLNCGDH
jgi:hypothetical protein